MNEPKDITAGAPVPLDRNAETGRPAGLRDLTERLPAEQPIKPAQIHWEPPLEKRAAELHQVNARLKQEMEGRQRALKALELSERRFRAIFNQSFQFIGLLNPDGTVLEVNQSTLDFIGLRYNEVVGRPLWKMRPRNTLKAVRQRIKEAVQEAAQGRFVRFEFTVTLPPEPPRTIDLSIKPVLNEKGGVIWLLTEGRDMTEHQRVEEELRKSEARLRRLSSQVLMAQETERRRVAKELHDGIGQYLSAIKYRVENALARENQDRSQDRTALSLREMIPVIQEAIAETRRICMDLRPSILDDLGILSTISWFSREFQKTFAGVRIDLNLALEENRIPGPLKTIIFRIIQEAMNNIAKHSQASKIRLTLSRKNHRLLLEITDNGRGFKVREALTLDPEGRGLGLASMQERAELFGGSFRIHSREGLGTKIRASWPLEE